MSRRAPRSIVGVVLLSAVLAACSPAQPPAAATVRTTKAFDNVYGALPPIPVQAPAFASVVYFPAADGSGRYATAPIFTTDESRTAFLTMRTAVRGIDQAEFAKGIALPFPKGADLSGFSLEHGKATVFLGGTFRAGRMSKKEAERAAGGLFLTASQFGDVASLAIEDSAGKELYRGRPASAQALDPGNPRVLGLLAIRERSGEAASAMSLLFDRPVFVDEITFSPSHGVAPYGGKTYATGFGMSVEFHPGPGVTFDAKQPCRIGFKVRDGKGRKADGALERVPEQVVRE
jgi:hypothetical protein